MKNPPPCLSRLSFAALLVYSPRGQSDASALSRKVRDAVKRDSVWSGQDRPFIQYAVEKLQAELAAERLPGFFGSDVGLVPTPRSAPLTKGALWPGERICQEMEKLGLGGRTRGGLERITPVQKAAFASSSGLARPTVAEHMTSMECSRDLLAPKRLLVVDDIVTSGSMLIAAASHLQAAFPDAEVRAFALLRTISSGDVEGILVPCTGSISYEGGDYARREP